MTARTSTLSLLTAFALFAVAVAGGGFMVVSAEAPAPQGEVAVQVTLQAGPTAAARTWRFEIVNLAGAVLQTLSLGTSGAAASSTAVSEPLPFGTYTVRQILGNDTKTACDSTAFYEVVSPAGAQASIQLGSARASSPFTIRPCPALPTNPQLLAPIDTLAPGPTTPIDEVRGARSEGPQTPLAPLTGSSPPSPAIDSEPSLVLVVFGIAATFIPSAGFALAHARRRSKR